MHLFDYARLAELARARAASYATAQPYPHAVLDDVARADVLERALAEFPSPERLAWYKYENPLERKLAMPHVDRLPDTFRDIFAEFNSAGFVHFVEALTGIEALVPDPDFNGGGLHETRRGGKLDVHIDYNLHPKTKLDRRVNVILYVNPGWKEEWGGHLELWDRDMTRAVVRVSPVMNRMVVFSTTEWSNHGHPDPTTCPEDVTRKSLALYYYTNGRPEPERAPAHSTTYRKRPQDADDPALDELRARRAKGRLADLTTKPKD